jgi:hypothetical protein
MRRALRLHPDCRRDAAQRIEVEATRSASGRLALQYVLTGRTGELVLPPPAAPVRADELWRHTCFELFLLSPRGAGYSEFNFAPSRQWAAYRFDSYRAGMRPAEEIAAPDIAVATGPDRFELTVEVGMPQGAGEAPLRLGLSAVVEETGGGISYWALAHPPGKPDFHHADGFALELLL